MNLRKEWYQQELEKSEEAIAHRPLEEEYSFYHAVSSGDMDFVQENCRRDTFTKTEGMGILSTNPLTNLKYHFVITVAMITRQCVAAGMELEQAYRLSDFYILKLDSCSTIEAVSQLHHNMALDFTGKMFLVKKGAAVSKPVVICMDFIYSHLNTRITVQTLSEYTGLSSSYLSRLFKKELGISISDYILEKKIEKSENLLKYSDYSLIDIANYLAFSSQSHFIQTFKKAVGLTPNKYRNQYYHSSW
ncbi:helix-turn-helix domain-containing protein [bacterium 1xD8-6]|jgi:AraC-type DNA-binding domain-containing proteins|nr:helix-turn-helix domain-containing protein [bacterium D16-36]RKI72242.1 helix-turn-helix domain-containing protein [bacterium 1xD8-6]